ncbi:MAG: CPBP family intramembrane metalloprotease [Treponema sp.]|jgi:membrane protease YdiL (CAAX protease family)|nr:CPBP family intramembrane metalloprotease [Treponema sp.]
MKRLIATCGIYLVFFLPAAFTVESPLNISIPTALNQIFFFNLPIIIIVFLSPPAVKRFDGLLCWLALFGLILLAFIIPSGTAPRITMHKDIYTRICAALSCIAAGYAEEGYFRYLLLKAFNKNKNLRPHVQIVLSAALFALCHRYGGASAMGYAFVAGCFLAILALYRHAFHELALAHGLYNILVLVYATMDMHSFS